MSASKLASAATPTASLSRAGHRPGALRSRTLGTRTVRSNLRSGALRSGLRSTSLGSAAAGRPLRGPSTRCALLRPTTRRTCLGSAAGFLGLPSAGSMDAVLVFRLGLVLILLWSCGGLRARSLGAVLFLSLLLVFVRRWIILCCGDGHHDGAHGEQRDESNEPLHNTLLHYSV